MGMVEEIRVSALQDKIDAYLALVKAYRGGSATFFARRLLREAEPPAWQVGTFDGDLQENHVKEGSTIVQAIQTSANEVVGLLLKEARNDERSAAVKHEAIATAKAELGLS